VIRRIAEWSVDHRAWVLAVTGLVAAACAVLSVGLELDALPDLTNNQVLVLTRAPGLTPEEVERLVSRPVEVALGGAPGLQEQRSLSRYGISVVTLVFEDAFPHYLARQITQERLSALSLPPGVPAPELGPVTGGLGEVFHFTLSSKSRSTAELLELVNQRAAPLLRTVPGVVEVNPWGGATRTLDVVADPVRLAQRQLTLEDLKGGLEQATGTAAGAALSAGQGQVLLRGLSRPVEAHELAGAVVHRGERSGLPTLVRVSDVAEVTEGKLVRTGAATQDGRGEVVYAMAQMLLGANALQIMDGIHGKLPAVRAALPPDVEFDIVYDRSVLVRGTLRTVGKNLLEGGLLVMAILFLLLGSVRAGLLVAAAIPLSMLGATAAMRLLDIPGNLMSLGAVDFGLLVDGAVVMVEGVFHALSHGPAKRTPAPLDRAGFRGLVRTTAGQLAQPVFFAVLIILLVYVPVLTLSGTDGKLFRPMAITVVFALAVSLVLALTFIPAAASVVLRPSDVPERQPFLVRLLELTYPPVLGRAMRHPLPVGLAGVLMLGTGLWFFMDSGSEFTPQLDEGDLVIQTTRAPDTSLESAVVAAGEMESALRRVPEVLHVASRIGSPAVATDVMGLEQADVFVSLKPRDAWRSGLTREALIAELEKLIPAAKGGEAPAFTQPIQMRFNELLGGAVTDVAISVYGEDLGELRRLAEAVHDAVHKQAGAVDVRVLAPPDVPLITVRPRPLDAAAAGLTSAEVLDAVASVRAGLEVGTTWRGMVRVPLQLKLAGTGEAAALESLQLPLPGGGLAPLSRVADVVREEAPSIVSRKSGERRLVVGFNVRGADLGTVVATAQAEVTRTVKLPPGYRLEWGGQYENLQAAAARLKVVIPLVLVLILAVLLYAFHKLRPALIIYSHVPFACVGGAAALWMRGLPVSLSAAVGFIALSGIAVMNGVVMLTRVRELEEDGASAAEAAREAALTRARPVLMTATVAALGFIPMMLAHGVGAEVQRPLATVVVGGLLTSTLLTLVLLPSLYPLLSRRRTQG
jgi:cobalt-zinc-cadmium resistance protein CzcA